MSPKLRSTLALWMLIVCTWRLASAADQSLTVADETCCQAIPTSAFSAGFDFVFAKPYWDRNPSAIITESNGATFESMRTNEFDYDFAVAPRIWLGYQANEEVAVRATYWQFDQDATPFSTNPPANGFGRVTHPAFGGVDIGSTIPAESFSATSYLQVHSVDVDVLKTVQFGSWSLAAFAGLRLAELDQGYNATLTNAADVVSGTIAYSHQFKGFGPTIGFETRRPHSQGFSLYTSARVTLLVGSADSTLLGGEDLDLVNPFLTDSLTSRNEFLPVGDLKLGVDWTPNALGAIQPFARVAFESQFWGNAGNASSEDGNLGFLGLSIGGGLAY